MGVVWVIAGGALANAATYMVMQTDDWKYNNAARCGSARYRCYGYAQQMPIQMFYGTGAPATDNDT